MNFAFFASIEVLIVVLDQCYHPKYLKVRNIDLLQIIAIIIITIKLVLTWIVEESNDKAILAEGAVLVVATRDLRGC